MSSDAPGNRLAIAFWAVALLVLAVVCIPEARAAGGIFVCPDGRGGKHFTNTPESTSCKPFRGGRTVSFSSVNPWSGGKALRRSGGRSSLAYDREITSCADRYRMDPNLIKAVIRAESSFNRHAVSRKGAQGLMQLMPETARELKVSDPFDARENIEGGTRYLRSLLDMFDGDLALALAAYNAGPTLVKKIRRVPSIPETRRYVKRVLAYYEGYNGGRIADAYDRSQIKVRGLVTVQ
jgi:soluble lytic murein transglycosylase-like protein